MAARFSGVILDRFSIAGECYILITPSKRHTVLLCVYVTKHQVPISLSALYCEQLGVTQ